MTTFHRIQVRDCNIFYREAGNPENPTILLLHGFPSVNSYIQTDQIKRISYESIVVKRKCQ